jgi:hypothetical protein
MWRTTGREHFRSVAPVTNSVLHAPSLAAFPFAVAVNRPATFSSATNSGANTMSARFRGSATAALTSPSRAGRSTGLRPPAHTRTPAPSGEPMRLRAGRRAISDTPPATSTPFAVALPRTSRAAESLGWQQGAPLSRVPSRACTPGASQAPPRCPIAFPKVISDGPEALSNFDCWCPGVFDAGLARAFSAEAWNRSQAAPEWWCGGLWRPPRRPGPAVFGGEGSRCVQVQGRRRLRAAAVMWRAEMPAASSSSLGLPEVGSALTASKTAWSSGVSVAARASRTAEPMPPSG